MTNNRKNKKVYILESGIYAGKKIHAFSTKDKLLTYRDNEIMEKWKNYSERPQIHYRNAKMITMQSWEEFRDDLMMDYDMIELEIQ